MEYIILTALIAVLVEVSYLTWVTQRANRRVSRVSFYLDTSVLIDGRIVDIAETGFVTAELVIPRSVLGELQLLADGADNDKRAKARKGLDNARKLREIDAVTVRIMQDSLTIREGVDNRLMALVKRYGGAICTIDYNLNKVAQVEGITVVNVNELAKNIRMRHLPGETYQLLLTQKGSDSHQAIGHLPDGTMVVVEHASSHLNQKVEIEFIRSLQTDAGKMMFARLRQPKQVPAKKHTAKSQQTVSVAASSTSRPVKSSAKPSGTRPRTAGQQPRRAKKASQEDTIIALVNKQ
jgi:uncharacterized protein YacL